MSHYEKAWQAVKTRIAEAAAKAGRDPASIALTAVSKTFPAAAVREVHALGQRAFGENYVQEGAAKRAELRDLAGLDWRLIGPLQSNKTAAAAAAFDTVETVDRLRIAERLAAARAAAGVPLDVLVQVNISAEATKSGVAPEAATELACGVAALPGLRLRGFMGIAAPDADRATQRRQFARLRACRDAARERGLALDVLSMGMSADFEDAIAEGSTEVRIGSAIFGARGSHA
ncbi:MAG: YggS family pyridoxal phosphate-dependent enzyme [Proteobacteria bacterium]|nr:YggS family pyridoxal phosphate-dependent enzyme [Pseudomonadota bacterium]